MIKKITSIGFALVLLGFFATDTFASHVTQKGVDQYGYNYQARLFTGAADGVDRNLDDKLWGDPTYANDHLVMKWSKAWDEARFHGAAWTADAWTDNEWNGKGKDGSSEVWHYKIVWVGPALTSSPYWREGGYPIWGEFEVVMDHGVSASDFCGANNGGHQICALATPNGYGGN